MRKLSLLGLVLVVCLGCSKSEPLSTLPGTNPAEADAKFALPAFPTEGSDFHKLDPALYRLTKVEVFSTYQYNNEDDHTHAIVHDVVKGELKVNFIEFVHPRMDYQPANHGLPLWLDADGTKTVVTQEGRANYKIFRDKKSDLKVEEIASNGLTLFENILSGLKANEKGVYSSEFSNDIGYKYTDRVAVVVQGNTVVFHDYTKIAPPHAKGNETITRYTYEKQPAGTLPVVPAVTEKLASLRSGKYELVKLRAYMKNPDFVLNTEYDAATKKVKVIHVKDGKDPLINTAINVVETIEQPPAGKLKTSPNILHSFSVDTGTATVTEESPIVFDPTDSGDNESPFTIAPENFAVVYTREGVILYFHDVQTDNFGTREVIYQYFYRRV